MVPILFLFVLLFLKKMIACGQKSSTQLTRLTRAETSLSNAGRPSEEILMCLAFIISFPLPRSMAPWFQSGERHWWQTVHGPIKIHPWISRVTCFQHFSAIPSGEGFLFINCISGKLAVRLMNCFISDDDISIAGKCQIGDFKLPFNENVYVSCCLAPQASFWLVFTPWFFLDYEGRHDLIPVHCMYSLKEQDRLPRRIKQ